MATNAERLEKLIAMRRAMQQTPRSQNEMVDPATLRMPKGPDEDLPELPMPAGDFSPEPQLPQGDFAPTDLLEKPPDSQDPQVTQFDQKRQALMRAFMSTRDPEQQKMLAEKINQLTRLAATYSRPAP